LYLPEDRRP